MPAARGRRLERRTRDIPLQRVDGAAGGGRDPGQFPDDEALSGAGQACDEDEARLGRERAEASGQRLIVAREIDA